MVYYRKYRPQTIEELDLESVRERLSSILRAKELPHAFLFTGPKGLGKTSAARILAKAINCEKVPRVPQVSQVSRGKKETGQARGTRDTLDTRGTLQITFPGLLVEELIRLLVLPFRLPLEESDLAVLVHLAALPALLAKKGELGVAEAVDLDLFAPLDLAKVALLDLGFVDYCPCLTFITQFKLLCQYLKNVFFLYGLGDLC